jgi:predicted lipoprotein with Yx(FWY)xxD motif
VLLLSGCAALGLGGCGGGANATGSTSAGAPPHSETFLYLGRVPGLKTVLINADDKTLYRSEKDRQGTGKTSCYGACARVWRPTLSSDRHPAGESGAFHPEQLQTIERRDGSRQVTYFGWPLYTYSREGRLGSGGAGQRSFGGIWYALRVRGGSVK